MGEDKIPLKLWTGWNESYGGLPGWANSYLQNWIKNMSGGAFGNYQKSLEALNKSDTFIDQQRNLMNRQYQRDISQPTTATVNNAMNQFAGRGTAGSSMSGDWMRNLGSQMAMGAQQQQNASNQWASQQKLGMLGQRVNAYQNFAQMMNEMLGLSKYQQSYGQGSIPEGYQEGQAEKDCLNTQGHYWDKGAKKCVPYSNFNPNFKTKEACEAANGYWHEGTGGAQGWCDTSGGEGPG